MDFFLSVHTLHGHYHFGHLGLSKDPLTSPGHTFQCRAGISRWCEGAQNRAGQMLLGTGSGQERAMVLMGRQKNADGSPVREPKGGELHCYCSVSVGGRKSSLVRSLPVCLQAPISAEGAGHAQHAGKRAPQGQAVFSA